MPGGAALIIGKLRAAGHEAYIVGGCVRDCLMGKTPSDWDITTSAAPLAVKALFKRTVDTGLRHGTVTVLMGRAGFEVTTFRVDGAYSDNRRPDSVAFTGDLREDLLRRDFTVNAMAYCDETGVVDPFNGQGDLAAGVIRGVGCPDARFKEDALRMLRAIRFSAQLGFEIEAETWRALKQNAPLIANISVERVRDELLKLLLGDHTGKYAQINDSGVLRYVDAGLCGLFAANLGGALPVLPACPKDTDLRLALLLRGSPAKETGRLLKFLRLDNKSVKNISVVAGRLPLPLPDTAYGMRKLLGAVGEGAANRVILLKRILAASARDADAIKSCERAEALLRGISEAGDCYNLAGLEINGEELKALGIKEGREIGRVLNALLDAVMQDPANNDAATLRKLAAAMTVQ